MTDKRKPHDDVKIALANVKWSLDYHRERLGYYETLWAALKRVALQEESI